MEEKQNKNSDLFNSLPEINSSDNSDVKLVNSEIATESSVVLQGMMPHDVKVEQMLIGSVLVNVRSIEKINEFLLPEHFFVPLHQKIYKAILNLHHRSITASAVTIKSMLYSDELFQKSNGYEYLLKLTSAATFYVDPLGYSKLIHDFALKRHLIDLARDLINNSINYTTQKSAIEQIEYLEAELYSLMNQGSSNNKSFEAISESARRAYEMIEEARKNKGQLVGISTGLNDLNNMLAGFHPSDLIILAGRPSMGKTDFAINLAINAANYLKDKYCEELKKSNGDASIDIESNLDDIASKCGSVGFFSLEMSSEQISKRLFAFISGIPSEHINNGNIKEEDAHKILSAVTRLSKIPLFIDETPALSINAIRARARRLKRQNNLSMLFVDYLQMVDGLGKYNNKVLEIGEITRGLKAIAKELNIPVVALSQLSRNVELRQDKRPLLSDLRDSGTIEQDADLVMFIYRDEYYLLRSEPQADSEEYAKWKEKLENSRNIAEIFIAKHRNGRVGKVTLTYDIARSCFKNHVSKDSFNKATH